MYDVSCENWVKMKLMHVLVECDKYDVATERKVPKFFE